MQKEMAMSEPTDISTLAAVLTDILDTLNGDLLAQVDEGGPLATVFEQVESCMQIVEGLVDLEPEVERLRLRLGAARPSQADVLDWCARHGYATDMASRAMKLTEEAGEVMGAVIKIPEGRKTLTDLGQELAQLTICAMTVAEAAELDLDTEIAVEWKRANPLDWIVARHSEGHSQEAGLTGGPGPGDSGPDSDGSTVASLLRGQPHREEDGGS